MPEDAELADVLDELGNPEAVTLAVLRGADGYLRVDYARLGLRLQTWDQWTTAH